MSYDCPEIEAYPSRERCGFCGEYSAVGFWVPNEIWAKVVPHRMSNTVSCIRCFARMADERLVQWDKKIKFYPVSLRTHMDTLDHVITISPIDEDMMDAGQSYLDGCVSSISPRGFTLPALFRWEEFWNVLTQKKIEKSNGN